MPQIPGLPIDQPAALPMAKPALFGIPGESVAGLGYETERMAQANMAFEGHLIYAQRQVKAAQAEIDFDRVKARVHDDLTRATTPEQAQEIYENSKPLLDEALAPYEQHDPALARELAIFRQREDVALQHTVNAKKADILTKNGLAAIEVLGEKHVQTAVNIIAGGGDPAAEIDQFDLQLQGFVNAGVLYPAKAEAIKQSLTRNIQLGAITAKAESADPNVREQNIRDLQSGKTDTSALDAAEVNQALQTSIARNKAITDREKVQDLDRIVSHAVEEYTSPNSVWKGDPDSYIHSIQTDTKHQQALGLGKFDPKTNEWIPNRQGINEVAGSIKAIESTEQHDLIKHADAAIKEITTLRVNNQYAKADAFLRKHLDIIEAPDKYKGIGAQIHDAIQNEIKRAQRTDADVSPRQNLSRYIYWKNQIEAGEIGKMQMQLNIEKDPGLREGSAKQLIDYIDTVADKNIRSAMSIVGKRQKAILAPSASVIMQRIMSGQADPKEFSQLSALEQQELDALTKANEEMSTWITERKKQVASGKGKDLTDQEIFAHGDEVARKHLPSMEHKLEAIHDQSTKGGKPPKKGDVKQGLSGSMRWDGSKWVPETPNDGDTKVNSSGDNVVFRNGKWVAQ